MVSKIIRIEKIILNMSDEESCIEFRLPAILGISKKDILGFSIVKKSIDARDKKNILFVYSVDVEISDKLNKYSVLDSGGKLKTDYSTKKNNIKIINPYIFNITKIENKLKNRPVIIGSGPAGLFSGLVLAKAGLRPIILERGQDVDTRIKDVDSFMKNGKLNPNSNIQFGEGGAGTFSDGKLYTLINDPKSKFIFEEFVKAGAPKEIIYSARPHIGTDKLRFVVKNLRNKIIELGGEVRFDSCLTDIKIEDNKIIGVKINDKEYIEIDKLILAIGHSARDTYEMLYKKGLDFQQKPFAMGVRIEHSADMINKSQFGGSCINSKLPTASYKLVNHDKDERSVYTFCMCPGGYVVAASSEEGRLTVNGMSEYKQDSGMSNSALLVGIKTSDFGSDHPLAGIEFQRKREEKAFVAGGSNYFAPAQFIGDFLKKQSSKKLIDEKKEKNISTYKPGIKLTNLEECLPIYVSDAIRAALPRFDRKIKGFADPDILLIGIEARSSAVVRIVRSSHTLESNISGIYPTGEGAGYAGGITSAAIDGVNVAQKIIEKYI